MSVCLPQGHHRPSQGHPASPPTLHGSPPVRSRASRIRWLLLVFAVSCSDDSSDDDIPPTPTQLVVDPAEFLGAVPCTATVGAAETEGALSTYQATLVDVTEGLNEPFVLPSSEVVSCGSAVSFHFVEPGHTYIAQISGFSRSDVQALSPGVSIVVDDEGRSVAPRWSTTCWGRDDLDYSALQSLGGAPGDPGLASAGAGGASGLDIGAIALLNTAVVVRGCEELMDTRGARAAGISVSLAGALAGLRCGAEEGRITRFEVELPGSANAESPVSPEASGGAAGAGGASDPGDAPLPGALCGETVVIEDLPPRTQLQFKVFAYSVGSSEPSHFTTCHAYTEPGLIIPASCDPLIAVDPG